MDVTLREYTREELAAQPVGAWTGLAYRLVVGAIREELAAEGLTQPHWWTLNHVAARPGGWDRAALVERLTPWDDRGTDFEAVFDELVARGWMTEDAGRMTLTGEGQAGRARARERTARVRERAHQGVDDADFATTVDVLRRMVANLGGEGDLPE
ncbi:MarR family transcriptional regulator [Streptomyces sp. NPDC058052]|uniref:MarR family transcriptional regulator n=1 Tax=Streptomyces sp. NPDC058052 TaxID=3346316 RepID=UPI0036EB2352